MAGLKAPSVASQYDRDRSSRTRRSCEGWSSRPLRLSREISEYYRDFRVSNDLIELRNLVLVSELIIRSAQARKESRGLHYTLDYPELLPEARNTVLYPENSALQGEPDPQSA